MRKTVKLLLTTIALTVAIVTPVFATTESLPAEIQMIYEGRTGLSNAISTLVKYDEQCGPEGKLAMHTLVDIAQANAKSSTLTEQQNYINYLKAVVGNTIETERIKKGNVAALTDLVKVNPSFQAQLDAAIVEYNDAVANHAAAEAAIIEAQKAFDEYNNKIIAETNAKGAKDTDVIK